jgi:CRISPR-associated protein Csx10
VTGWNIALKLPKEDEVAISKGSVFLFVTKPGETISEPEVKPLSDLLEQIEKSGIGERRNEGFGKVRICDEFHWEVPNK